MKAEPGNSADAPIGDLLVQLSTQTSRLVRDEMRLAQKEFAVKSRDVVYDVVV